MDVSKTPPEKDGYCFGESKLWLKGSTMPLSSKEARNILLRRQTDFEFEVVSKVGIIDMKSKQDYGLTCYYDENTWLKYGLFGTAYDTFSQESGSLWLRVIEHIGDKDFEKLIAIKVKKSGYKKNIYLKIETHFLQRRFSYSYDGEAYSDMGVIENVDYLCDEGLNLGKRFTGAMVGMYVYGCNESLHIPFSHFDYVKL